MRVEWSTSKPDNGGYGLYPVMSDNVLVEDSVVKGASDADSAPCPKIPKECAALGVHDKTKPGDSNDAGAWKVDSTFAP